MILSMAKSLSFNFGPIVFNSNTFLNSFVKDNFSFIEEREKFEENFVKLENEILANESKKKKIIIFIDELDRCEPENILNLLTALKHFFSNGNKTFFFCGIDKDAVTKAVRHKYQDIVKSEEYLEKIFDISFNMPIQFDLKKLLNCYFLKGHVGIIEKYLKSINFTNPRHLKKVLNKLLVLQFIQDKGIDFEELIPKMQNGNTLNGIFVLHFIILFEFYKDIFFELKDLDKRMHQLAFLHYKDLQAKSSGNIGLNVVRNDLREYLPSRSELMEIFLNTHMSNILKALHLILTIPKETIDTGVSGDFSSETKKEYFEYLDNFISNEDIQVRFAKFILQNQSEFKSESLNYEYNNLFKMAEKYL